MSIITLGDVLDRACAFEVRLEELYAEVRDRSADNGVRLLTYYLARHRRRQQRCLIVIEAAALLHIRKIELKFDVPFHPEGEYALLEAAPEQIKGDELLKAAIQYDTDLVHLYREILRQPLNEEAQSMLASLIQSEEKDIVMLQKMLAMHYF